MLFYKNILTLSILAAISIPVFAAENENVEKLETIRIKAHPLEQTSKDFAVADTVVDQKHLTEGAALLGMRSIVRWGFMRISLGLVQVVR